MRTVLLLVAALAMAAGPALALRCHVCRSSSNCKEPRECPASARYCTTVITGEQPLSRPPGVGTSLFDVGASRQVGGEGAEVAPGSDHAHLCPVEPLSGNLVKKDCVDSCTSIHTQQGQVSSGAGSTQCCQGDLCNAQLHSAAPTHTTLTRTVLGLGLALGLLALLLTPNL
ncbi:Lymphocyte antigen 6D [Plecturocebus cupreus]